MANPVHHIELWTHDLATAEPGWHWLLDSLGWERELVEGWPNGRIWRHASGVYVVLEASAAVIGDRHDRLAPGLNHLALRTGDRAGLDALRAAAPAHGWSELFTDKYPHAGGPDHTALYLENAEGFEVELVVDS
ncbi:VOC family protein [Pseudactinotalea suaedae]|uniref:VOC family protein n=1 Tax=Pseudactinotalea suaedae TaxID=1524924 RepID=UPI0012E1C2E4|nr:VOC family protein [Pseudactinotalea suaedae]